MSSTAELSLGVIGLGRMAQALVQPLLELGELTPPQLRACVANAASAEQLAQRFGIAVGLDPRPALGADFVLLAIKPQQLDAFLSQWAPMGPPAPRAHGGAPLLISVLAGVRLERLQASFPGWRVVRAVPNTPALVRQGLVGLAYGEAVGPSQRQQVQRWFGQVGEVFELPESQLDGFLALTSSGPAFAALVVEALVDGAVAAGLPRALATPLAQKMLSGTMALLEQQGLHPGQLKDMVSSPAGTTIAGLRVLEQAGLRSALIEAVLSASERSRALR